MILFAENENIDIKKLLSAISGGATAGSWQMENRALTMSKRKFDFAIKWTVKDLSCCLDRSEENKADLSFTKSAYDKYQKKIKEKWQW